MERRLTLFWFNWRDPRGKQHRQSTQTADPQGAALFRLQFMQTKEERFEELTSPRASYGKLPLKQVADLYFKQTAMLLDLSTASETVFGASRSTRQRQ